MSDGRQEMELRGNEEVVVGGTREEDIKLEKSVLRGARELCWAANDEYEAKCEGSARRGVEKVDAARTAAAEKECAQLRARILECCRPSWARHFERKRGQKASLQRALDSSSLSASAPASASASAS